MLDFLKRGYNNVLEMIAERDKLIDIQTTVKLAADDGVVTFDEIRENLRKYADFPSKCSSKLALAGLIFRTPRSRSFAPSTTEMGTLSLLWTK